MLAFAIALRLDMPRPYWAMASAYITSNQLTGATWSKAVYRMLGTLIGAAGVIALIPNLVDAPELLSFAIALWVGICLYLSLIDGTPRSYLFMLSGYTVALLGFPVLSMPELTFDIVVARVQEIMLGIICASVVSMLVLPRSVGQRPRVARSSRKRRGRYRRSRSELRRNPPCQRQSDFQLGAIGPAHSCPNRS
jgi:uncharacterized membrane protein YccC